VITAGAPYAPSTCSHTPWRSHTSATSASGSIAPVFTVPALATTATGSAPIAMSSASIASRAVERMRSASSTGTVRICALPIPSSSTAF
jgi:hypothetical protein